MATLQDFDVVVIGAGRAGRSAVEHALQVGWRVGLVDDSNSSSGAIVGHKAWRAFLATGAERDVDLLTNQYDALRRDELNRWRESLVGDLTFSAERAYISGPREVMLLAPRTGDERGVWGTRNIVVCSGTPTQVPLLWKQNGERTWSDRPSGLDAECEVVGWHGAALDLACLWARRGYSASLSSALPSYWPDEVRQAITASLAQTGVTLSTAPTLPPKSSPGILGLQKHGARVDGATGKVRSALSPCQIHPNIWAAGSCVITPSGQTGDSHIEGAEAVKRTSGTGLQKPLRLPRWDEMFVSAAIPFGVLTSAFGAEARSWEWSGAPPGGAAISVDPTTGAIGQLVCWGNGLEAVLELSREGMRQEWTVCELSDRLPNCTPVEQAAKQAACAALNRCALV